MVYFLFLLPTSQDRLLRAMLVEELRALVFPTLQSLGFESVGQGGLNTKTFPTKYYRLSPDQAVIVNFIWMKRGEPAFVIDFDLIDKKETDGPGRSKVKSWFNAPRYRASSSTSIVERWFHIGYLPRLMSPLRAAHKEVEKARSRIYEIDRFARTGETSPYFRNNMDSTRVPVRVVSTSEQ